MSQAERPSCLIDASKYQYVVGIDIGSQTCSCCVLKPDKSPVIKPIEFPNAMPGFTFLQEKLEALGVASHHILIGLEATSRNARKSLPLIYLLLSFGLAFALRWRNNVRDAGPTNVPFSLVMRRILCYANQRGNACAKSSVFSRQTRFMGTMAGYQFDRSCTEKMHHGPLAGQDLFKGTSSVF